MDYDKQILTILNEKPGLTSEELRKHITNSTDLSDSEWEIILHTLVHDDRLTKIKLEDETLYYKTGPTDAEKAYHQQKDHENAGNERTKWIIIAAVMVVLALFFGLTETGGMVFYGLFILGILVAFFMWLRG